MNDKVKEAARVIQEDMDANLAGVQDDWTRAVQMLIDHALAEPDDGWVTVWEGTHYDFVFSYRGPNTPERDGLYRVQKEQRP